MPFPRPEHSAPPPPAYAPTSGGADAALAGMIGAMPDGPAGAVDAYPAAAIMARHCGAVTDYATLLTASRAHASMVVSAAFARVLDELRHGGGAGTQAALRPRLLVAARRTVQEWAGDPRIAALLGGPPAPAGPGPDREFLARAFAALPGPAQVLLWHREVEAEGISIPAALLAIDPRAATARLGEARELLRAGCLHAHSELAADPECRHYNRLLDISLRRGGALIPDIRRHLAKCPHCRYAADQLSHSDGRLPLLLAEAVLGEGARGYVESRPARSRTRTRPGTAAPAEARRTGRHSRAVPAGTARRLAGAVPGGGALLAALAVAGVLGVVAVASLWPDGDRGGPSAVAPGGTAVPPGGALPAPGARPTAVQPQPPSSAGLGGGTLSTRLRNAAGGLCLDVRDGTPLVGADLTLAPCSGSPTQEWRYERDGLLHSAAAPDLCPHSQESSGVVVLRLCATQPDVTVRYDLSVQGHVVPRWNAGLGLVPTAPREGTTVVVKVRDGSVSQRWLTDGAVAAPSPRRAVDDIDAREGAGAVGEAAAPSAAKGPADPADPQPDRPSAAPVTAPGRGAAGDAPPGERYGVRSVSDPAPGAQPQPQPDDPEPGAPEAAQEPDVTEPADGAVSLEGAGPIALTAVPGAPSRDTRDVRVLRHVPVVGG
ncbi:ricin-type beta-trefoil lectin domain protein [Streptomyces lavendulocolor]|uniref:ricin-type beta-trefoil lectin domain protein n=1 Tax=Streptomyces lavendulocolor TaxID=67316 RepID=UPI003C2D7862